MRCLFQELGTKMCILRAGIHDLDDRNEVSKRVEELLQRGDKGGLRCPHENGQILRVIHHNKEGEYLIICDSCHHQFKVLLLEQEVRCPNCDLVDSGSELNRMWTQRSKP